MLEESNKQKKIRKEKKRNMELDIIKKQLEEMQAGYLRLQEEMERSRDREERAKEEVQLHIQAFPSSGHNLTST